MGKTLGQVIVEARSRCDDLDIPNSNVEQFEMRNWVNEALREIAFETECYRATTTVAVTAGTSEYTGPTDCVRIIRAEFYTDASGARNYLEYRDWNGMDAYWGRWQVTRQGNPEMFSTWGHPPNLVVKLYPVPSNAGTLKLFYTKYPAEMEQADDSNDLDVPGGYEDLVADFLVYRWAGKDGDDGRLRVARAEFDRRCQRMRALTERYVDAPGQITVDYWGAPTEDYY